MLRKLAACTVSGAVLCLAAPAMAQQIDNQNYNVNVNIEVAEEVSVWAGHENVSLLMNGADGNNFAGFESSIHYINNTDAQVDVEVSGTLPTPLVSGGGINFFIFDGVDAATAQSAVTANAYTPAGALVWNQASLGTSQTFDSNVGTNTSAVSRQVTYASASPGELPLPDTFDLDVLWTIAALP